MSQRLPRVEVAPSTDGLWFWRLRAANGAVLATSETYANKANAQRGAQAAWSVFYDLTDAGLVREVVEVAS